jgi:hypothetical protein
VKKVSVDCEPSNERLLLNDFFSGIQVAANQIRIVPLTRRAIRNNASTRATSATHVPSMQNVTQPITGQSADALLA